MIEVGCKFSDDTLGPDGRGRYRYTLVRHIKVIPNDRLVMFVGLNPSTADEFKNDPTVERCQRRAMGWQFGRMAMMNIFAIRSTDPKPMLKLELSEIIGPQNNEWLIHVANQAELIIAAWGTHGKHRSRGRMVYDLLSSIKPIHCLRRTKHGYPEHPLYLPYEACPIPYDPR